MTYRGAIPPGQAFNGQQPMPGGYPTYVNGHPPPNPPYHHAGYAPQHQLYPPQQHVPYPVPASHPIPTYDGAYGQHGLPRPAAHYAQPAYPQQIPLPMPAYPPAPMAQPILPPLQLPQVITPTQSPQPSQNRRISSEGAIQKPSKGPRKSTSSAIAKSPSVPPKILVDAPSLLICVADDCFTEASGGAQKAALSSDGGKLQEYHKLIATGLSCLEAALQSNRLTPRVEAMTRLRYASIVSEETENLMEAETSLGKNITLCEKHRFPDLKLYTQFLLMKALFRRNRKAAMIALDGHISDCVTYKNVYWTYAFRFLKASFYLQSTNPADAHALENLRSIGTLANDRGDVAVYVLSTLMEGLTYLKAMRDDAIVRVQTCIAQASKYQLDSAVHIPQLDVLTLVLDLACSLLQKVPETANMKLDALQRRLDELKDSPMWKETSSELLLPLRKQTGASTISNDTSSILRPGDGERDYMVMTAFSKAEAYVLGYSLTGVALLYKNLNSDRSFEFWNEALSVLSSCERAASGIPLSLHEATRQAAWRAEVSSYVHIMMGLQFATRSEWAMVKDCLQKLERLGKQHSQSELDTLALYLTGVYQQGVGELDTALQIFGNRQFTINASESSQKPGRQMENEISLLAALNRLLIMQAESFKHEQKTADLVEQLGQICPEHPDPDIRTAYNLMMAAIQTQPSLSINQVKRHIQLGLQGSQLTNNTHCLAIALNIMRCRLFENVVGEQALKSAKAGSAQAKKSGNLLWMSVAEGMLSHSYEVQGAMDDARSTGEAGTRYANESWNKTQ